MKSAKIFKIVVLVLGLMIYLVPKVEAEPMGTAITYQGSLNDAGAPADGLYDFQFRLFDDANNVTGNQVGSTIDINDIDVIEGYFTVELDFGIDVFAGEARWLETTVAQSDGSDPCTLSPRLELTPTPYAIYAETAGAGHSLDAADGYPTDVVYVDNGGYVGIGTTSPLSKLSVVGTGYFKDNVGIGTSTPESKLSIQMRGQSRPTIPPLIAPGLVIKGGSWNFGNQFYIQDSFGNPSFLVDYAGNVGIGTNSSQNKLDVEGTVAVGASYSGATTGPTNGMIIEGNVGIGTTSPTSLLDVYRGAIRARVDSDQYIEIEDTNEGGYITSHSRESNKRPLSLQALHDDSGSPYGSIYMSFIVGNESSPKTAMTINDTGNDGSVGIGTTSPVNQLHLHATSGNPVLRMSGSNYKGVNGAYIRMVNSDGTLRLGAADSLDDLTITSAGNVGIGMTSPSAKLDVNGYIQTHDSLPFSVKRFTGTLDILGSKTVPHGIANGHLKILTVQAWRKGSGGSMMPMEVASVDSQNIYIGGGGGSNPYRVAIVYSSSEHTW